MLSCPGDEHRPMRLLVPPLLLLLAEPGTPARCSFETAPPFRYAITGRDGAKLAAGLPIAVAASGGTSTWWSTYNSTRATVSPLEFLGAANTSGADAVLGPWDGQRLVWSAGGTPFATSCKNFARSSSVVFEYTFDHGASFTAGALPPEGLLTQFPAFSAASMTHFAGALSWEHDTMQPANRLTLGPSSGPTVFLGSTSPTVMVVSPLNHFMTSSALNRSIEPSSKGVGAAAWGTVATVRDVPPGFTHRILVHEGRGLTQTLFDWGQMMQQVAAGSANTTAKLPDITLRRLGYSTDNGAMYCYCKAHCDTILLSVKAAWDSQGLPMAYLTFEGSWFENNWSSMWCVSELVPKAPALDMALGTFIARLRAPIHGYVPYFCNDSTLFKPLHSGGGGGGGGKWSSLRSSPGYLPPAFGRCNLAHPLPFDFQIVAPDESESFFTWLFLEGFSAAGNASARPGPGSGLAAFESDFFEEQQGCVAEFGTNVSAAQAWFDGFTAAARNLELPLQYSMAIPSNLLTSLSEPAVTNFRVSGDYASGAAWDIGFSSLLVWALGAAPSKDTFWTNNQSDAAKSLAPECRGAGGCPPDHSDAGCELHSMLALMSTGPVQPSDSVGRTRTDLLLRTMRIDGVLLQPSKPITALDRQLHAPRGHAHPAGGNSSCCPADRDAYYAVGGGAIVGGPCGWELCAPWGTNVLATYSGDARPGPPAERPPAGVLQWAWYFLAHSLRDGAEAVDVFTGDFWPPLHFESAGANQSQRRSLSMVYREWHESHCVHGAAASSCTRQAVATAPTAGAVATVPPVFSIGDSSLPLFAPQLVTIVPSQNGFALLGELGKYCSMSRARFSAIERTTAGGIARLRVTVRGAANERVEVTALVPAKTGQPAAIVSVQIAQFSSRGGALNVEFGPL